MELAQIKRNLVSSAQVIELMGKHYKDVMGVTLNHTKLTELRLYSQLNMQNARKKLISALGLKPDVSDSVLKANIGGLSYSQTYLPKTPTGAVSLDVKQIQLMLEKPTIPEPYKKLMREYVTFSQESTFLSNSEKYTYAGIISGLPTNTGDLMRLYLIDRDFTMESQTSTRIGYQGLAFQNFNKDKTSVFCAPYGYDRMSWDSGQIDPTIALSIIVDVPAIKALAALYKDVYFAVVHACTYLTDEQLRLSNYSESDLLPITDELREMRQKVKMYTNGVLYGKESNPEKSKLLDRMVEVIGRNPARLEFMERAEYEITRGNYTVTNVFGDKIDITKGGTANMSHSHLLNAYIANYVQSAAAALNRYNVYNLLRYLGLHTTMSSLQLNIHDSVKLNVHKSERDAVMQIADEICAYNIDGWIPIRGALEQDDKGTVVRNGKGVLLSTCM